MKDLSSIVAKFKVQGTIEEIKPLGTGLINDTYKVNTKEADAPNYVLQRINHAIFQNVEMLQSNITAVTNHIRKKLTEAGESDIERKVLSFLETEEGKAYWFDGDSYWRVMVFIPRAKTYETVNPEYSNYAGEALVTSRLCWPIFRKHWVKPYLISTTWSSASNNFVKLLRKMLPDGYRK